MVSYTYTYRQHLQPRSPLPQRVPRTVLALADRPHLSLSRPSLLAHALHVTALSVCREKVVHGLAANGTYESRAGAAPKITYNQV
jgi:hypothetical protein